MGRSSGSDQERQSSADAAGATTGRAAYVDRGELVAAMAARYNTSEPIAAAAVRVAEALRATAAEYPDLSDEDAITALRAVEDGVQRAGVPRPRL